MRCGHSPKITISTVADTLAARFVVPLPATRVAAKPMLHVMLQHPVSVGAIARCCHGPHTPQNVAATAGANPAAVSWQAPASNGGSPITAYKVVAYVGTTAENATYVGGSATSVTMTGLAGGTIYTFQVSAVNGDGTGLP